MSTSSRTKILASRSAGSLFSTLTLCDHAALEPRVRHDPGGWAPPGARLTIMAPTLHLIASSMRPSIAVAARSRATAAGHDPLFHLPARGPAWAHPPRGHFFSPSLAVSVAAPTYDHGGSARQLGQALTQELPRDRSRGGLRRSRAPLPDAPLDGRRACQLPSTMVVLSIHHLRRPCGWPAVVVLQSTISEVSVIGLAAGRVGEDPPAQQHAPVTPRSRAPSPPATEGAAELVDRRALAQGLAFDASSATMTSGLHRRATCASSGGMSCLTLSFFS